MKHSRQTSRRSERGMTLIEALIAVFIFTVVFLTALALYQTANRAYLQTDAAAIQQQNVRFGMDRMLETLRDSGAGYNPTGTKKLADEQIEGAWESAVFVRGDFDNSRENTPPANTLESTTFPIVTTGNDEIVGYVLRKSTGANNVTLTIRADFAAPRVAIYTSQASIADETDKTVRVAATTVDTQTDPPYQLAKVTFDASGTAQYEVIADNIFRMKFEYYTETGNTAITNTSGATIADDTTRDERASIRRIKVKLIGMADRPDFGYTDGWTYGTDFADMQSPAAATNYRKFAVEQTVFAANLGVVGRRHNTVPALDLNAPEYITVCTGHCRYFHVRWPASTSTGVTSYRVYITAPIAGSLPAYTTTEDATTTELIWKDPDTTAGATGVRAFTFKVAATAGGIEGTYSPVVSMTSAEDSANQSIPEQPGGVGAAQAAGSNAMSVSWTKVETNTGTVSNSSYCATAGVGGSPSHASSWSNNAVDLEKYKIYRVRNTASWAGDFTTVDSPNSGNNQIDTGTWATISGTGATLANTTPGGTASTFTDSTAAPCSTYFYRLKACDLCGNTGALSTAIPAAGPADPGVNPAPPAGLTGTTVTSSGNYNVTLNWPAVSTTAAGRPAAVTHYKVYRKKATSPSTTFTADTSWDVYEATPGVGHAQTTFSDSAPTTAGTNSLAYQYYVSALYDCAGRESTQAGPYTATCAATNSITITLPSAGMDISTPFENGFTPSVTVSGTGSTGATAAITGPSPSTAVVWSGTASGAGPVYDTWSPNPAFDATTLPTGTYTFSVSAMVGVCQTATYTHTFQISNATCGLIAELVPVGGGNAASQVELVGSDNQLVFKVRNNCDATQGGIPFTVTGLKLVWSGEFASNNIISVRLGSPGGTTLTGNITAGSNTAFSFLSGMNQTINAGSVTGPWYVLYSGDMRQNNVRKTTWSNIFATTTTPENANDDLLTTPQAP